MDRNSKAEDHYRRSQQYLRNTEHAFPLDAGSGIHTPATKKVQQPVHVNVYSPVLENQPQTNGAETTSAIASVVSAIISFVTVIGLFLTVYFSIRQWAEAHRTADASIIAAEASQDAANTASNALKAQQDSFQIDQRPYLICEGTDFSGDTPAPGAPLHINANYRNIGKTPAGAWIDSLDLLSFIPGKQDPTGRERYNSFLKSSFRSLHLRNLHDRTLYERIKAQHDLAPQQAAFSSNEKPLIIGGTEFPMIAASTLDIFAVGVISYKDAHGRLYDTEYCYFYTGLGKYKVWHICDQHNTIR